MEYISDEISAVLFDYLMFFLLVSVLSFVTVNCLYKRFGDILSKFQVDMDIYSKCRDYVR